MNHAFLQRRPQKTNHVKRQKMPERSLVKVSAVHMHSSEYLIQNQLYSDFVKPSSSLSGLTQFFIGFLRAFFMQIWVGIIFYIITITSSNNTLGMDERPLCDEAQNWL